MHRRRISTAIQALLLGGLLIALATGVPLHGHAGHDGEGAHVGHPGHDHGVGLLRQEMRLERPTPPLLPVLEAAQASPAAPPHRSLPHVAREEPCWDSRAPPSTARPRAPPV